MSEKIKFDDWSKLDIRVGKILEVEDIEGADKLYKLEIDIGDEKRIVCAGIKKYYKKEELQNKLCVVFVNLEPKTMKGIKSDGMLLAVDEDGKPTLIIPEKDIEVGSKIR